MRGPTSSYAAPGIALLFIGAHKPPHPATYFFRQGADNIEGGRRNLQMQIFELIETY
jgi:hypothetical protein